MGLSIKYLGGESGGPAKIVLARMKRRGSFSCDRTSYVYVYIYRERERKEATEIAAKYMQKNKCVFNNFGK